MGEMTKHNGPLQSFGNTKAEKTLPVPIAISYTRVATGT